MDLRFLETVYQQWANGQTDPAARWLDFVELASRQTYTGQVEIMEALQKTPWFQWRREE
jgi:hypothetical protein